LCLTAERPHLDAGTSPAPLAVHWIAPARDARVNAWDKTGKPFPRYGATPSAYYLLRPDGHVLARWKTLNPAQVTRAIALALK
jgi:hypothetical protein